MRRRTRERQEKRKDGPILKKLRATLLPSFRGLHGGSARGNWDSREVQQPF